MAPEFEVDNQLAVDILAWTYSGMDDQERDRLIDDEDHGVFVYKLGKEPVIIFPRGEKSVLYTSDNLVEILRTEGFELKNIDAQ